MVLQTHSHHPCLERRCAHLQGKTATDFTRTMALCNIYHVASANTPMASHTYFTCTHPQRHTEWRSIYIPDMEGKTPSGM